MTIPRRLDRNRNSKKLTFTDNGNPGLKTVTSSNDNETSLETTFT